MVFWGFLFLIIGVWIVLSSIRRERAKSELISALAEQEAERRHKQKIEEFGNTPLRQNTIITLTEIVVTAFMQAAQKKNETIPNTTLLNIAGKMVLIYQTYGDKVFASQLQHRLDQYLEHGLQESDMKDFLQLNKDTDINSSFNPQEKPLP